MIETQVLMRVPPPPSPTPSTMGLWETLGKDGLTKESYETFGDELREIFLDSVREAKEIGLLSTSQRQTRKIEIKDS